MPRAKKKLTWMPKPDGRGAWRKIYQGKPYYFCTPDNSEDSYKSALGAWELKKVLLDGHPVVEAGDLGEAIAKRSKMLAFYDAGLGSPAEAQAVRADLDRVKAKVKAGKPLSPYDLDPALMISAEGQATWAERTAILDRATTTPEVSVTGLIEKFLESQRVRVDAGQITPAWFSVQGFRLQTFKTFAAEHPLSPLDSKLLLALREFLLGKVAAGEVKSGYAANIMKDAKTVTEWAASHEMIEIPKILLRKAALTIEAHEQEVKPLDKAEVNRILDLVPERCKLYLLLMLNCGMSQRDIADLRHDEVKLEAGIIKRKRSKTAKHKNVPQVSWPLWAETRKLLAKFQSKHDELFLVNENGLQLVRKVLKPDGKLKDIDNIKLTWKYLCTKHKLKVTLRQFRSTSSTMLDEDETYGRYAQYFLGHSPRGISAKHYIKPSQTQFAAAVKWLGEQYGLT